MFTRQTDAKTLSLPALYMRIADLCAENPDANHRLIVEALQVLIALEGAEKIVEVLFSRMKDSASHGRMPDSVADVDTIWALGKYYEEYRRAIIEQASRFPYVHCKVDCFRLPCQILCSWFLQMKKQSQDQTFGHKLFNAVRQGYQQHTDIAKRWRDGTQLRCCCSENGFQKRTWDRYGKICPAYAATYALLSADFLSGIQILAEELGLEVDYACSHHVWERSCDALGDFLLLGKTPRLATLNENERKALAQLIPHIIRKDRFQRTSISEPAIPWAITNVFGHQAIPALISLFGIRHESICGYDCHENAMRCLQNIGGAAELIARYGNGTAEQKLLVAQAINRIVEFGSVRSEKTICALGEDGNVVLRWLLGLVKIRPFPKEDGLVTSALEAIYTILQCPVVESIDVDLRIEAFSELLDRYNAKLRWGSNPLQVVGALPEEIRVAITPVLRASYAERQLQSRLQRAYTETQRVPYAGMEAGAIALQTQLIAHGEKGRGQLHSSLLVLHKQLAADVLRHDQIETQLKR